ncbi:MAG: T9SS type A sorting domain-containing protein [Bacteroidetes bacterium]|nr:MAG: T9SS type A sorting domain-containing protein [Bacteroidota bacterium]
MMLGPERPEDGSIWRLVTAKSNQPGDAFTFSTTDGDTSYGVEAASLETKQAAMDLIGIVPNPYKGSSAFERSQLIDEVRFTGMPSEETIINVFTLNGSLIKTIFKPEGVRDQAWNLTTDNSLPIASGMYLIHVDVKGVGSKVIKFAAIKKRVQLNTF